MTTFNDYDIGKHRVGCPSCGRGGRDRTAGLKIDPDGSGVIHCFRCSYTESHRPERGANISRAPTIKPQAQAQKYQRLSDWGTEQWKSTHDLGGIAAQYLRSRRCVVPAYGDLRWLPSLKHPSGYVGPALVALITDIHTREPLSLHRTWITESGKADIENPRLLLGNHSIVGGVIRLYPDDEVTNWLGLAEGIETGLSLAWAYRPVWATIDAGHLAQFPLLAGVGELVIAVDQDPAGITAANTCATRWVNDNRTVLLTNQSKNDLNDVLTEVCHER